MNEELHEKPTVQQIV